MHVKMIKVLIKLFQNYKVEAVLKNNEDMKMTRKKMLNVINNSKMILLLQMLKSERMKF